MDGSKRIVVFKMNLFSVINSIFKASVISLILQPHSVLVFQDLTWNCLADSLLSGFGFLWGFFLVILGFFMFWILGENCWVRWKHFLFFWCLFIAVFWHSLFLQRIEITVISSDWYTTVKVWREMQLVSSLYHSLRNCEKKRTAQNVKCPCMWFILFLVLLTECLSYCWKWTQGWAVSFEPVGVTYFLKHWNFFLRISRCDVYLSKKKSWCDVSC